MKSIIQEIKQCWFCGTTRDLHDHHIFTGANRPLSEKYGMKVWVCGWHHNLGGNQCVHLNRQMADELKRYAQGKFEEIYKDVDFIKVFGKNYKDE